MRVKIALFAMFFLLSSVLFFGGGVFMQANAQVAFPTNLTVTPISACAVELNWTQDEPGAYYFNYDRDFDNLFFSATPFRIPPAGDLAGAPVPQPSAGPASLMEKNSGGLIGLFSSTAYYYKILACDQTICSVYSSDANATTLALPSAPGAPAILDAVSFPSGSIQDIELSWATTTDMSFYGGFSVYMSVDGGPFAWEASSELWAKKADGTLDFSWGSAALSHKVNGLSLNSSYSFIVRAYDSDLNCRVDTRFPGPVADKNGDPNDPADNNQVKFSTDSNQVVIPILPTNLAGSSTGGASPVVNLTWNDNSTNESNFEIHKSVFSNFSTILKSFSSPTDSTSYSDSNVNANSTYYYRMKACNGTSISTCSIFSNSVAVSTGLENPALRASIIYASPTSELADVFLQWSGAGGADNHDLERSTSATFSSPELITSRSGGGTFYHEDIPFGEKYYYRVKATGGGQTAFSNIMPIDLNIEYVLRGVGWAADGPSAGNYAGVGWIKFNSALEGGQTVGASDDYSVQIDRDGLISGEAWATIDGGRGYGWLSFNQIDLIKQGAIDGCPSDPDQTAVGPPCEARMDATGNISGWARFLAPRSFPSGVSGWDGWVSLRDDNVIALETSALHQFATIFKPIFSPLASLLDFTKVRAESANPYGVNLNLTTKNLSGIAWGNDVVGWIGFGSTDCSNCTVRATLVNRLPVVGNVTVEEPPDSWCAETPFYRVHWEYSDPDGDPQQSAEIQFVRADNGTTVDLSVPVTGLDATNTCTLGTGAQNKCFRVDDPLGYIATGAYNSSGYLNPNTEYIIRAQAFDGIGFSNWASTASNETTPTHYYPLVDFSWTPDPTAVATITTFTDASLDRSSGAFPLLGRLWQFIGASQTQSASPNPSVIFNTLPSDPSDPPNVSLAIEDAATISCVGENTVTSGGTGGSLERRIFRER